MSDITYIRVNDNWNYLTTIIAGWALSEDMTTKNTVTKLVGSPLLILLYSVLYLFSQSIT